MKKVNFRGATKAAQKVGCKMIRSAKKHSPIIFIGLGVVGLIASGIDAVCETPKACEAMDKKKEALEKDTLTVKETIQTTWTYYIRPVAAAACSTGMILFGTHKAMKQGAAMAALYSATDEAFRRYKEANEEVIGKEKAKNVAEKAQQKAVEADETDNSRRVVIPTGGENVLCKDSLTGQYFYANPSDILTAADIIKMKLMNWDYASMNEWLDNLNLENSDVGDILGWNVSQGVFGIYFEGAVTKDNKPVLVVEYNYAPKYDYMY